MHDAGFFAFDDYDEFVVGGDCSLVIHNYNGSVAQVYGVVVIAAIVIG